MYVTVFTRERMSVDAHWTVRVKAVCGSKSNAMVTILKQWRTQ
jgi:hypothetical protein